jgi:hypothetical protein
MKDVSIAVEARLAKSNHLVSEAKRAFKGSNFAKAGRILKHVLEENPYCTPAVAWQIPILRALGRVDEIRQIVDYQYLRTYSVAERHDADILTHEFRESLSSYTFAEAQRGNVPLRQSDLSLRFFDVHPTLKATLLDFVMDAFSRYLLETNTEHHFVNIMPFLSIEMWVNRVRPGGQIGAHYHPRSWLSCVYYPASATRAKCGDVGSIEFGPLPDVLGGGENIPSLSLNPRQGLMLVFPSYFGHLVRINKSGDHRFSVGIDIIVV